MTHFHCHLRVERQPYYSSVWENRSRASDCVWVAPLK